MGAIFHNYINSESIFNTKFDSKNSVVVGQFNPDRPSYIRRDNSLDATKVRVVKGNELLLAQMDFTARELKILNAVFSQINPLISYPFGLAVSLTDSDLEELTGINKKHLNGPVKTKDKDLPKKTEVEKEVNGEIVKKEEDNPSLLLNLANKLHSKPITMRNGGNWVVTNLAQASLYTDGEFTMVFGAYVIPHLIDLKKYYTSYVLSEIIALTRPVSIHFYETVRMLYRQEQGGLQQKVLTFEELWEITGVTKTKVTDKSNNIIPFKHCYYNNNSQFIKRVLKPMVEEISTKTSMRISYEILTKNGKHSRVKFSFIASDTRPVVKDKDGESIIEKKDINGLIKVHGIEKVKANAKVLQSYVLNGKGNNIKNPAAYLSSFCNKDVAAIPDKFNPYSQLNKDPRVLAFCKEVVVDGWQLLPIGVKREVLSGDSGATLRWGELYDNYEELKKVRKKYFTSGGDYSIEELMEYVAYGVKFEALRIVYAQKNLYNKK